MAGRHKKRPEELMKTFTVRIPPDLMERLKDKAGPIALSLVIRELVEMFVDDEVNIDWKKRKRKKES
jgi:hypothetical protein